MDTQYHTSVPIFLQKSTVIFNPRPRVVSWNILPDKRHQWTAPGTTHTERTFPWIHLAPVGMDECSEVGLLHRDNLEIITFLGKTKQFA